MVIKLFTKLLFKFKPKGVDREVFNLVLARLVIPLKFVSEGVVSWFVPEGVLIVEPGDFLVSMFHSEPEGVSLRDGSLYFHASTLR